MIQPTAPVSGAKTLLPCVAAALLMALPVSGTLAQVVDSAGAGVRRSIPDSLTRPPLSPARAFIGSLLLPGLSQSILKRPTAMAVFTAVEVTGWSMLLRSMRDLRRAKRYSILQDSAPSAYVYDPATGKVNRDPETGAPIIASVEPNIFADGLIVARRKHVEDWAAIVVFNHVMAGADALVAAHLWDVPIRLGVRAAPQGALLVGTFKW
jgi:hypothetical protein